MKTMNGKTFGIICAAVAVLAVLIIGGIFLAGPKQQTEAPVDDNAISQNDLPAEEPDPSLPPESSSDAEPSQPEPEETADPETTDDTEPAETDDQETDGEQASDQETDDDSALEQSSGSSHMVDERTGAIYSYDLADYPQPDGMPAVSAMPQNPLPPVSLNGIYDIERTYPEGYYAPNDENNPYHYYFGNSSTFYGVAEGSYINEHAFVISPSNGNIGWTPAMDGMTVGPNGEGGAFFVY